MRQQQLLSVKKKKNIQLLQTEFQNTLLNFKIKVTVSRLEVHIKVHIWLANINCTSQYSTDTLTSTPSRSKVKKFFLFFFSFYCSLYLQS